MEMFISIMGIVSFVFMNVGVGYMMVGGIYNAIDPGTTNRTLIATLLSAMMVVSYCTGAVMAFYGYKHISDVIAENKKHKQRKAKYEAFDSHHNHRK